MTSDEVLPAYATPDYKTLGVLWIAYGVVRSLMALWLATFSGTATVMFGALLSRVPDPFSLMSGFHLLYLFLVILSAAAGIFGVVAGVALLTGANAGRRLALIAAFLSLSEIPIGITLSAYTLIVLLVPRQARATHGRATSRPVVPDV
jgi:hypothetical protein